MNKKNVLLVFVKAPRPGLVKTRLAPPLSPDESAQLYRAMVEDLFERIRPSKEEDVWVFYHPRGSRREVSGWLGRDIRYRVQQGRGLGGRMEEALRKAFQAGYSRAVLTGSDIPELGEDTIGRAFQCLRDRDLVLGPSRDGGYYLVGMKKLHACLFRGLSWSTDRVLDQTLALARKERLSVDLIEPLEDVDCFEDAVRLWKTRRRRRLGEATLRVLGLLMKDRDPASENGMSW